MTRIPEGSDRGERIAASALRHTALRRFERMTVTCVSVLEGKGVHEDPCREVRYYFADDGALLWHDDKYGPAEYGKLSDFPSWALDRVAENLSGQKHNPAIASFLDAVELEQARRQVPA